jgi:hypothetical protein
MHYCVHQTTDAALQQQQQPAELHAPRVDMHAASLRPICCQCKSQQGWLITSVIAHRSNQLRGWGRAASLTSMAAVKLSQRFAAAGVTVVCNQPQPTNASAWHLAWHGLRPKSRADVSCAVFSPTSEYKVLLIHVFCIRKVRQSIVCRAHCASEGPGTDQHCLCAARTLSCSSELVGPSVGDMHAS